VYIAPDVLRPDFAAVATHKFPPSKNGTISIVGLFFIEVLFYLDTFPKGRELISDIYPDHLPFQRVNAIMTKKQGMKMSRTGIIHQSVGFFLSRVNASDLLPGFRSVENYVDIIHPVPHEFV
jgi:hypothetical protein